MSAHVQVVLAPPVSKATLTRARPRMRVSWHEDSEGGVTQMRGHANQLSHEQYLE